VIGGIEDFGGRQVGHVYTIDVAVKRRRKGVGTRLLKDIENIFINHNVDVIYLEVRANNEAARRLYETQGYRAVEAIENYYSTGIHGLRMIKYLKSKQNPSP
jgi:ribosomal-protein-alanine N-acetyltransferase